MRIIAGRWRGRVLAAPAGDATRPTADRMRQAIFDMLLHAPWGGRDAVEGAQVLDVFAGTGAMGLEALSRGAAHATFIETAPAALAALRANIRAVKAEAITRVLPVDATRLGAPEPGRPPSPDVMARAGPPSMTSGRRTGTAVDGGPAPAMTRGGSPAPSPANLVFLDPPYGADLIPRALAALRMGGWLAPEALIVAETGRTEAPPHPDPLAERVHGAARVSVWREPAGP